MTYLIVTSRVRLFADDFDILRNTYSGRSVSSAERSRHFGTMGKQVGDAV